MIDFQAFSDELQKIAMHKHASLLGKAKKFVEKQKFKRLPPEQRRAILSAKHDKAIAEDIAQRQAATAAKSEARKASHLQEKKDFIAKRRAAGKMPTMEKRRWGQKARDLDVEVGDWRAVDKAPKAGDVRPSPTLGQRPAIGSRTAGQKPAIPNTLQSADVYGNMASSLRG